jgi:hypothetical protein
MVYAGFPFGRLRISDFPKEKQKINSCIFTVVGIFKESI